MTTGPRLIQASEILSVFPDFPEELAHFPEASNPIFAGYHRDQPACIAGFIPQQTSGEVLLWGWTTSLIAEHPLIHARWARRLIARVHQVYPTIIGYCSLDKRHWIELLGGTTQLYDFHFLAFRIEAHQ